MNIALQNQANDYIRALSPYQPGKPITELSRELNIKEENIIKLASNENPLGISPKAKIAIEKALSGLSRYPDQFELKNALADDLNVNINQIVLGNGSNNLLDLIARIFLAPGLESIYSEYAFAIYPLATLSVGAKPIMAKSNLFGHNLNEIKNLINEKTKVIWIANPNNPTGTFLPHNEILDFIQNIPKHIVVVIDEAYNEYLPKEKQANNVEWIQNHPNIIITRTFSKIYGLAGLRIGYAVTSLEIADLFNRIRTPFNVNNLALVAALSSRTDFEFLNKSFENNQNGMQFIENGLKNLNYEYIPSSGNFITIYFNPEKESAESVNLKLLKKGIIVRPLKNYNLPNHLRVTIGTDYENARFLEELAKI